MENEKIIELLTNINKNLESVRKELHDINWYGVKVKKAKDKQSATANLNQVRTE